MRLAVPRNVINKCRHDTSKVHARLVVFWLGVYKPPIAASMWRKGAVFTLRHSYRRCVGAGIKSSTLLSFVDILIPSIQHCHGPLSRTAEEALDIPANTQPQLQIIART